MSTYLITETRFYQNGHSGTSQAQHIRLATNLGKHCCCLCLDARRAPIEVPWRAIGGVSLSKYLLNPICAFYEKDDAKHSQAQHIQITKHLIKHLLYLYLDCAAGAIPGHVACNCWCWRVHMSYNTLLFCVYFMENDRAETSQAQHIRLAKHLIKPCYHGPFECVASAN